MLRMRATVMAAVILLCGSVFGDPQSDRPGENEEGAPRHDSPAADRQGMPPLLRAFDVDGDGHLSSQEIDDAATTLKGLDADNDGKISPKEFRKMRAKINHRRGPDNFERDRPPSRDFDRRRGPRNPGGDFDREFERDRRPPRDFDRRRGPRNPGGDFDREFERDRRPPRDFDRRRGPRNPGGDFDRNFDRSRRGPPRDFDQDRPRPFSEDSRADLDRRRGPPGGGPRNGEQNQNLQRGRPSSLDGLIDRIFERDEDGDGRLSRDEMSERGQRMFDWTDTDRNGLVDRFEIESVLTKK